MKRFLSVLLVLLAVIHIAGVAPLYMVALEEAKTEALLELGYNSLLQRIFIANDEVSNKRIFNWKEEGEFTYRGKLYDYSRTVESKNGVVFYAIEDKKESLLLDLLTASFEENNSSTNNNNPSKILKNFSKHYLPTEMCFRIEPETDLAYEVRIQQVYLSCGYVLPPNVPPDKLNA